jgi:hypothetical protein
LSKLGAQELVALGARVVLYEVGEDVLFYALLESLDAC